MRLDPMAVVRCWAIDVDVGGATYTIPALPASEWLLAVLGALSDVVPGLLTRPDELDDQLIDGHLGEECRTAAREAITAASGTTWWTATRLAQAATQTAIGWELTSRGVDPTRLPFAAYLGAVYRTGQKLMDEQGRARWDWELDKPPAGVRPADWFDPAVAAAGFEAAMAAGGDG